MFLGQVEVREETLSAIIGVVREIMTDECRVGLTPRGVKFMAESGYKVVIEEGAGLASGFSDAEYVSANAEMAKGPEEVFQKATIIKHVKQLLVTEYKFLEPRHIVFAFNHFEGDKELTLKSLQSKATFVSYEKVVVNGKTPLLAPMSRIAGALAVEWTDIAGKNVVIMGGGVAGETAAVKALEGGASLVVVAEKSESRRIELENKYPRLNILNSDDMSSLLDALKNSHIIIGAVYVKGRTPLLIGYKGQIAENGELVPFTFEDITLGANKPKQIVDIAVDQGGNVALVTDRIRKTVSYRKTSLREKFVKDAYGNMIAKVPNVPSARPRQASLDLEEATLPYLLALAKGLTEALEEKPELVGAISIQNGKIMDGQILRAHPSIH